VYAHANQLYQRVKPKGDTLYLKCKSRHSDGSVLTPQRNRPTADTCEVCLLEPRSGVALVPCRSFCSPCTDAVTTMVNGCPIRRSPITAVLRLSNYSSLTCLRPFTCSALKTFRYFNKFCPFRSTWYLLCYCARVKDVLEYRLFNVRQKTDARYSYRL